MLLQHAQWFFDRKVRFEIGQFDLRLSESNVDFVKLSQTMPCFIRLEMFDSMEAIFFLEFLKYLGICLHKRKHTHTHTHAQQETVALIKGKICKADLHKKVGVAII